MTDVPGAASVPPARTAGRYRVGMVCSGNICRSPTAAVVLAERLADLGLDDRVTVASCGLGDWHVGDPMDPRSAAVLTGAGYDATRHRAQVLPASWAGELDLLLAMDGGHRRALLARGADPGRVLMFRAFDPLASSASGTDVPDPYYGGPDGFEEVLAMVERTADALAPALAAAVGRQPGRR